ncbi:WYL domain-containing protein [Streptomyces sp. NPDC003077]|uniref:WYL domain-containing protein n=1 Tax=Streptomyces sp. NPDC003077 TaxID=3154443 RepID=UPI0033B71F15
MPRRAPTKATAGHRPRCEHPDRTRCASSAARFVLGRGTVSPPASPERWGTSPTGVRVPPREPPDSDAASFVARKMYALAPTYEVRATVHLPAEQVIAGLNTPPEQVQPIDGSSCRLHGSADTLEWMASRLLVLGCEFEVHDPPELVAYLQALAGRAGRAAAGA